MGHTLRTYETILVALLVAALLVSVLGSRNEWIATFGPNAATEIFGILITVMLVERALARERRAEQDKQRAGALVRVGNRLRRIARRVRPIGDLAHSAYETPAETAPPDEAAAIARRATLEHLRSPEGRDALATVREELRRIEEVVNSFPDLPDPYADCFVRCMDAIDRLCDFVHGTAVARESEESLRLVYSLQTLVRQILSLAEETRSMSDSAAVRIAEAHLVATDEALLPLFVQPLPAVERAVDRS